MRRTPSGTVTFLFTDIEGSTQRWDRHREAMRVAVELHDEILQREIEAHGGYVFKTVGDAFCAAFEHTTDAMTAAISAQRELARTTFPDVGGLRVRMGLHRGVTIERGGDYFGPEVNRVARLMSIGHGGQVLVSGAVEEQVASHLPDGSSLIDLGLRRLKDLTLPERVWQLSVAGLRDEFPPLESLDARPNNLPVQVTALRGRERDLVDLRRIITEHRVVTITGSGGVGKTRVALQLGADLIDRFADGVWFVDLSPMNEPAGVAGAVALAMGIDQVPGKPIEQLIPQRLARKNLLVVIDNCEHLVEAVAVLVDAIVRQATDVRIVATSRQAIGVAGEAVYRLPSLAVPDAGSIPNAAEALEYGSIAVFVDRARLANTRFTLGDDSVSTVADICRRLDGIPLAIELAAARTNLLSLRNLAQRLDERFKLLTGGSRTALPRQQTLGALIDWSYNLLTPPEQALFARLSVFSGGFDVEAATNICRGGGIEPGNVLQLLDSLVDKSLLVADVSGDRERYHLLESTRAYAAERLAALAERVPISRRHAEYFRDVARAANERYGTGSSFEWLAGLRSELDNFRAALEWSVTQRNDDVIGGEIAGFLNRLWRSSGLVVEGRHWIGLGLDRVSEEDHPKVVARLWRGHSHLSSAKTKIESAQRAFDLYRSLGDARGCAWAQISRSLGCFQLGRLDEASGLVAQARETFGETGDRLGLASSLQQEATIAEQLGDDARARDLIVRALADFRSLGNESGIALALGNLGELEFKEGRPDEAIRLAGEALELHRLGKDRFNVALYSLNLGAYRIAVGDLDAAARCLRDGLALARELQSYSFAAVALQHLSLIAAMEGRAGSAGRLLGYVDAQFDALGVQRELTEQWGYDKLRAILREHLSDDDIAKLAREGATWSEDRAAEEGAADP